MTTTEERRNGTAAAMPVRTVDIHLDEAGYPGWVVIMRTNPRASVYDALISPELGRWWTAFGQIVQSWNLTDEDGHPIGHPREFKSDEELDLPIKLLAYVLDRYFDAVRAAAALPKVSSVSSDATLSINVGDQKSA